MRCLIAGRIQGIFFGSGSFLEEASHVSREVDTSEGSACHHTAAVSGKEERSFCVAQMRQRGSAEFCGLPGPRLDDGGWLPLWGCGEPWLPKPLFLLESQVP